MVWNPTQSAFYKMSEEQETVGQKSCENNANENNARSQNNRPDRQCCNCRYNKAPVYKNDPLSKIFSDSDMLLIVILIFILYRNGADKKLIMALAFVLVC